MPRLDLSEFQYALPEEQIAKYPLAERDSSRLLVFEGNKIQHSKFTQLADFLPVNSALFFNNTKVIPARILFEKPTGGTIEVFLLNPSSGAGMSEALTCPSPATWQCTVGNARRWPGSTTLVKIKGDIRLTADWNHRPDGPVSFSWTPANLPFARITEAMGAIPLPPYLRRKPEGSDTDRYQTVYSKFEGAVAAPTAGLHFTPTVLEGLRKKGIRMDYLTLHVSAGTFLPIKSENAAKHRMHEEEIIVHKQNIISLLEGPQRVIAVGTTAMRTLESLYWYGVKLQSNPDADFTIAQEFPYQMSNASLTLESSLELVLKRMQALGAEQLVGYTSIYVMPGYRFRVVRGLITNFHQPGSSLLVLVSAFVGAAWKDVYREALEHRYRFLSYGDSSLLLPNS